MSVIEIIMIVALLVMGVFLVVSMLFQKSNKGLSGTIAGGAETFFGAQAGKDRKTRILSILTTVISIIFVLIVFAAFLFQPDYNIYATGDSWHGSSEFFSNFTA